MGKNKNVGCGCDYCMSRGVRRDFRHGGVDESDFDERLPYRKPKRKRRGVCAKSKDGSPCEFTVRKIIGTTYKRDWKTNERTIAYLTVITCNRCGKYNWKTYKYV